MIEGDSKRMADENVGPGSLLALIRQDKTSLPMMMCSSLPDGAKDDLAMTRFALLYPPQALSRRDYSHADKGIEVASAAWTV